MLLKNLKKRRRLIRDWLRESNKIEGKEKSVPIIDLLIYQLEFQQQQKKKWYFSIKILKKTKTKQKIWLQTNDTERHVMQVKYLIVFVGKQIVVVKKIDTVLVVESDEVDVRAALV